METLISDWSASETRVDSNWKSALRTGTIAIVAAATVYATGGVAGAYAPAIWLGYLSGKSGVEAASIDLTQYLEAMGTVQSLMDDALTDIQIAYRDGGSTITFPKVDMDGNKVLNDDGTQVYFEQDAHGYLNTYKEYMKAVAKYLGRNADDDVVQALFDEVQEGNGRVTVGVDSDQQTHTFATMFTYEHFPNPQPFDLYDNYDWFTKGLPKNHRCGGVCGEDFGTPLGDHGKVCAECRDIYYSCKINYKDEVEDHKVRYCKLKIWKTDSDGNLVRTPDGRRVEIVCPYTYRDCTSNWNVHTAYLPHGSVCREKPNPAEPDQPYSLTLTPGVTTIELRWTPPERSGSSDITDYKYSYRFKNLKINLWTDWSSAGTGLSKTITDLQAGTNYEVRLRAVNSAGEGVAIYKSVKTKAFSSSLSLRYNSSTGTVRLTATAKAPIFGADLYVRFPGDTSKYGTKIGWTSGNSNRTTYSLPVNYSFPASAASGRYKFTLRVYPFNNSGSGNAWGDPVDVSGYVTLE